MYHHTTASPRHHYCRTSSLSVFSPHACFSFPSVPHVSVLSTAGRVSDEQPSVWYRRRAVRGGRVPRVAAERAAHVSGRRASRAVLALVDSSCSDLFVKCYYIDFSVI